MKPCRLLLCSCLLALPALTGLYPGGGSATCVLTAEAADTGSMLVADARRVVPATHYSISDPSPNDKDPMWRQYVGRGQAFTNCPPETRSYAAPAKKSTKKAKKRYRTAKAAPKKQRIVLPPVQADLFPDAICPDGCVPAPRTSSLRRVSPTAGSAITTGNSAVLPVAPVTTGTAEAAAPAAQLAAPQSQPAGQAAPTPAPASGETVSSTSGATSTLPPVTAGAASASIKPESVPIDKGAGGEITVTPAKPL